MNDILPIGRNYPKDQIDRNFTLKWISPPGRSTFAFRIMVPSGWVEDDISKYRPEEIDADTLFPLSAFSDSQSHSFLQVQVVRLAREISAVHWLHLFLEESNHRIDVIVEISDYFSDSLSSFEIEGNRFKGRMAASVSGEFLYIISAFCPESYYETLSEVLGICIASFRVILPPTRKTIEGWQSFSLDGTLRFQFPDSWATYIVPAPPKGKAAVDLISTLQGSAVGLIRVKRVAGFAASSSEVVRSDAVEEIKQIGIVNISENINSVHYKGNQRFQAGKVHVYAGKSEIGIEHEAWITIAEGEDEFCVITMITASKKENFYVWSVNRRAYDIITQTIE